MRVLVDTNILLDLLQQREPFYNDALNLCISVINGEIEGYLSAGQITDLHYILRRELSEEETRAALFKILGIFPLLETKAEDVQCALAGSMDDFEDAVIAAAAKRERVDAIVTRNEKDFKLSPVPAYFPGAFLTMLDLQ